MSKGKITVVGAGILGLWQAFEFARRGYHVNVHEALPEAEAGAASRFAGAMLAPYCEAEAAPEVVLALGLKGLKIWREAYPGVTSRGSLVIAAQRDQRELDRFSRMSKGHQWVDAEGVATLEPALAGRVKRGLFYPEEAHVAPRAAMQFLISSLRAYGAELQFDAPVPDPVWLAGGAGELVIDARGMSARSDLPNLRGVRGEMGVLKSRGVRLTRPIRLLHPRFPLYVVPWGDATFMIGASVIENESGGNVTVRSALDLLGAAYTVHPGLAEAQVLELSAGVRPAFFDNVPQISRRGRCIRVNGAYRHGFLLAPVLAKTVADYFETGRGECTQSQNDKADTVRLKISGGA